MSTRALKLEYGDYQTPAELADASCRVLHQLGMQPRALLEPTSGLGQFLKAGITSFPTVATAKGFDINPAYVRAATVLLRELPPTSGVSVSVEHADFFDLDWPSIIAALPQPLLVLGNPPWVTNTALGLVGSDNLPAKSNFQRHAGLDALTGKSNFDISEYMLMHLSEALQGKNATLAMLCKIAVARKLMAYCWKRNLEMDACHMFPIDAQKHFGAAVGACLFVASFNRGATDRTCIVHQHFDAASRHDHLGYRDGLLVSDVGLYEKWRFLRGRSAYTWRSGLKHDCADVMEFSEGPGGQIVNGLGEATALEDLFLFPLLKSSAVAGPEKAGKRWVLVTQRSVGEDTSTISRTGPKTWRYLLEHAPALDARASIVYKKRPRFSIFGIGDYSFAPWKVVISGFYKKLDFRMAGPHAGRPVMLDDTAYFLGSNDEQGARTLVEMLNSPPAREFLSSLVFWDAKRPITIDLLSQLSLERLADHLGKTLPGATPIQPDLLPL